MDKEKEHIIADKTMLRVARVTSIVFTPFSIPFLAFLVLFLFSYLRIMPILYKGIVLGIVYCFTILTPTITIFLFRKINGFARQELSERKKRYVPILLTIISYVFCLLMMRKLNIPWYMTGIIFVSLVISIICILVNLKWKLSEHMAVSLKQRGRTVNQIIFSKLPVSARTAGLAVVVALCVGIPLGCLSAYNRGKWADNLIIVFATCGIAIPSFISSVVLLYTFGMNLKLLPTVGLNEPAAYIMPVTALAIYPTAYITRLMRSSLLDVMGQDYMRTARAKGVSSVKILFKHALRNAILPVITYVGPMLAGLMTGSFVVEKIFSIPGLGRDFVSAITNRDYMMIMGTTILLATLVIVANVVVDILYKIIDPRIKLK